MPITIDMSPNANYASSSKNPAAPSQPSTMPPPLLSQPPTSWPIFSHNLHPPESMIFPFHQMSPFSVVTPTMARRKPPKKRRRFTLETLYSILYQVSFSLFILITAALLLGSAWGLGEEAWRTGGQKRWNIAFLVAAYVSLVSPPS